MNENHTIHLADVPIGGKAGFIWNRLHGDREEICEALLKDGEPVYHVDLHRDLLQARLRKIDDALDRLMSGSYGICSKCGRTIESATLNIDPAWSVCLDCWDNETRSLRPHEKDEGSSGSTILLRNLTQFDTAVVKTQNSVYRILLLDPNTGRALIEGGSYLPEPSEAVIRGSAIPGEMFDEGAIKLGARLEMWAGERIFLTSPILSMEMKHSPTAESVESISEALH